MVEKARNGQAKINYHNFGKKGEEKEKKKML